MDLGPQSRILEYAGGIPFDPLAGAEPRGGRPPPTVQSTFEQVVGGWPVIEDGDRRHPTHSGRIVGEPASCIERNQNIVGELVLCDDLSHGCGSSPGEDSRECQLRGDDRGQLLPLTLAQPRIVEQWNAVHGTLHRLIRPDMEKPWGFMPAAA